MGMAPIHKETATPTAFLILLALLYPVPQLRLVGDLLLLLLQLVLVDKELAGEWRHRAVLYDHLQVLVELVYEGDAGGDCTVHSRAEEERRVSERAKNISDFRAESISECRRMMCAVPLTLKLRDLVIRDPVEIF